MPVWSGNMKLSTFAPARAESAPAPAALDRIAATAAASPAATTPRLFKVMDFPPGYTAPFVAKIYHRARRYVLDETGAWGRSGVPRTFRFVEIPAGGSLWHAG